jgi:hypothetical protein
VAKTATHAAEQLVVAREEISTGEKAGEIA